MLEKSDCPFCDLDLDRVVMAAPGWFVVKDAYPVADGHTLLVPQRHIARYEDLEPEEKACLLDILDQVLVELRQEDGLSDWNFGLNNGPQAGQTVGHLHFHIIPRRAGDVGDPRGGVRWVIPEKAAYWSDD